VLALVFTFHSSITIACRTRTLLDVLNPASDIFAHPHSVLTSTGGSSRQAMEERAALFPSWQNYVDSAARAEQPEKAPAEASFVSIEP
jgi:hypothetical protein